MTKEWHYMEKPLVQVVNGVLWGSPAAKTLEACGRSGFGLGTSLVTPFTTLPQIMSYSLETPDLYIKIDLDQCFYFNYVKLGLAAMKEIPLY